MKTVVPVPKWILLWEWVLLLIRSFPLLFFAFFGLIVFMGISGNPVYIAVVFPVGFFALAFLMICVMSRQKKV